MDAIVYANEMASFVVGLPIIKLNHFRYKLTDSITTTGEGRSLVDLISAMSDLSSASSDSMAACNTGITEAKSFWQP